MPNLDSSPEARFETINTYAHGLLIDGCEASPATSAVNVLKLTGLLSGEPIPFIYTGAAVGPVHVQVRASHKEPPADSQWEDVAEMTLDCGDDPVRITAPATNEALQGKLNGSGGGLYRVRVSARNRDVEYDLVAAVPLERYLVESWPVDTDKEPLLLSAVAATAQRLIAG